MSSGSITTRLARVLFTYRITPQSTTGISPAELLLGRRLRTRLDLLRPNTAARVEDKQLQQKARHDITAKHRVFVIGDTVFVKNFSSGYRWLPGEIVKVTGPVSFVVDLEDGRRRRYHQNQIRHRLVDGTPSTTEVVDESIAFPIPAGQDNEPTDTQSSPSLPQPIVQSNVQPMVHRYPQRSRTQRQCYEPGMN